MLALGLRGRTGVAAIAPHSRASTARCCPMGSSRGVNSLVSVKPSRYASMRGVSIVLGILNFSCIATPVLLFSSIVRGFGYTICQYRMQSKRRFGRVYSRYTQTSDCFSLRDHIAARSARSSQGLRTHHDGGETLGNIQERAPHSESSEAPLSGSLRGR